MKKIILVLLLPVFLWRCDQGTSNLQNDSLRIQWKKDQEGWKIESLQLKELNAWKDVEIPSGEYTFLYSAEKPDSSSVIMKANTGVVFPENIYHYQTAFWKLATNAIALNRAGEAVHFFPATCTEGKDELHFSLENPVATMQATWTLDKKFPNDIVVHQTWIARKAGYFSFLSPTLLTVPEKDIAWATVPGYFQGNAIQKDSVLAYAYGQGIPSFPAIYRERCVSTLTSIVDTKDSVSVGIIPVPGLGRDPWTHDHMTQEEWSVGISHMNRRSDLSPTLYFPVLGEPKSKLKAGDTVRYSFRYHIEKGTWFQTLKHTANNVYQFKKGLALRSNKQSLTSRIHAMHHYLTDAKTSLWNIENFNGLKIGGQSYLGGVVGSQGDAMKNADYGAMWMLAKATDDPLLQNQVLPYALNFKMTQQQTSDGFFKGAAMGQYYLRKKKMFVEEWGDFVEPISLTYYIMLDVGNILLFKPDDQVLRDRLKLGADLLLKWQKADGSWEVAYDKKTTAPLFTDIKDLRPTFYGLIVAYRILKEEKYLEGAKKGALWMISNAVSKGHFIGVCGDARYAPDFATGQTAQALLDLYDITHDDQYRVAAIEAARIYTTSVYTQPTASTQKKIVKNVERQDWEISQSGLSFEHGGIMGSAQRQGPILLASHAGLFVRIFNLTKDSLFIDMARAAAIGRDAFVDPRTSVASYYWFTLNKGAGPYPHHAWWQIGWITDYLMAESELRSEGKIKFERGFVTPKVGPHQTYGFSPGRIFDENADLIIRDDLITLSDPNAEHITALSSGGKKLFVILLNDLGETLTTDITIHPEKLNGKSKISSIKSKITGTNLVTSDAMRISLEGYGIEVLEIILE
jgi:hypothetical protein